MNERFFQGIRSNKVRVSVGELELPIQFYDVEAMFSFFPVAGSALAELLPSPDLVPALFRPAIGFLGVAAMEYKKSSVGAYNEMAVLIPSLWRPKRNWPLLPFLAPRWFPNLAAYIFKLPVTTEFPCAAGREIWGLPKFIAEIEFEDRDSHRVCTLSHEGMMILRYTLQKPAVPRYAQRSYPIYTRKGPHLLLSRLVTQGLLGISRKPGGAELEFGRHPLGTELSALAPGPARWSYYYPKMQGLAGWAVRSFDVPPRTLRSGLAA